KDIAIKFDGTQPISGSPLLVDALRLTAPNEVNEFRHAGLKLSPVLRSLPSVDEALHYFSGNERVLTLGKLAIAAGILIREKPLSSEDTNSPYVLPPNVWLAHFFSLVIAGTRLIDPRPVFENVTIINFNYDRSLEYYLY